jgi:hypothetical protein
LGDLKISITSTLVKAFGQRVSVSCRVAEDLLRLSADASFKDKRAVALAAARLDDANDFDTP